MEPDPEPRKQEKMMAEKKLQRFSKEWMIEFNRMAKPCSAWLRTATTSEALAQFSDAGKKIGRVVPIAAKTGK
jgi:hypothetical protein